MSFFKKLFYSFTFTGILSVIFLFIIKSEPLKSKVLPMSRQALTVPNVFARVGEYEISILSGWTSPYAEVALNGQGTNRKTIANEEGYFEFRSVLIKKSYGELCLTSVDVTRVSTLPICLAPIPPNQNVEVTGVLLPPSISLEKGKITAGESTKASGMTFPNSDVDVYLFENHFSVLAGFSPRLLGRKLKFAKTIYAAGLPKYEVRSNEDGYFEFSLPTKKPSENRLFATSFLIPSLLTLDTSTSLSAGSLLTSQPHLNYSSPKSNTLSFLVFKPNWLVLILILLLIAILILIMVKNKPKSLVPYQPVCITDVPWGSKILRT